MTMINQCRFVVIVVLMFLLSPISWAANSEVLSTAVGQQVQRAFKLYESDKNQQALQQLNKINAKTDFDEAYINRFKANLYWALGNQKQALLALEIAVAKQALSTVEHQKSQRMLADLYLNQQQNDKAISLYRVLVNKADSEDLYKQLALAYYQKKSWRAVITASNHALKRASHFNKSVYLLKLRAFYELQDYQEASKILVQLTQVYPHEKRWWMQLGTTYRLLNQLKKALAIYELAYLNGFIKSTAEVRNLARLRANLGVPYQAALLLESAMANGTVAKNAQSYQELASFWQVAREHDKAQQYWGKSAALSGNGKHRLIQAQLLQLLGRYQQTLAVLNKINTENSKLQGKVALAKIQVLFELENYSEALNAANFAAGFSNVKQRAAQWLKILQNKQAQSIPSPS